MVQNQVEPGCDINLADARQQAAECRRLLALGKDPIAERDGERARTLVEKQRSMTFDQCSQAYIAAHRDGWRNAKHASQRENTFRLHASPVIGKLAGLSMHAPGGSDRQPLALAVKLSTAFAARGSQVPPAKPVACCC